MGARIGRAVRGALAGLLEPTTQSSTPGPGDSANSVVSPSWCSPTPMKWPLPASRSIPTNSHPPDRRVCGPCAGTSEELLGGATLATLCAADAAWAPSHTLTAVVTARGNPPPSLASLTVRLTNEIPGIAVTEDIEMLLIHDLAQGRQARARPVQRPRGGPTGPWHSVRRSFDRALRVPPSSHRWPGQSRHRQASRRARGPRGSRNIGRPSPTLSRPLDGLRPRGQRHAH